MYKLKAILLHSGGAEKGGHHKALVQRQGVWFECNDSVVKELSTEEADTLFSKQQSNSPTASIFESAYMLIHQLHDDDAMTESEIEAAAADVIKSENEAAAVVAAAAKSSKQEYQGLDASRFTTEELDLYHRLKISKNT
jgi:hypothetical protein